MQALIDYLEIDGGKTNEEEIAGDRKSVKSDFLRLQEIQTEILALVDGNLEELCEAAKISDIL